MVDATLRRAGPCGSLFMIPPGVLWPLNETAENIPDAAFQLCFASLPRTCILLCSLEVRRTLFKERCERLLCFRRAHPRGELFVLDFYRLRDLLALRMLHQSLASLQRTWRFRSQLLSCFRRGGQQFFVGHYTGD